MKILSRFKSVIPVTLLFIFLNTAIAQAEVYKWLKTTNYEEIFVYTEFSNCDFMENNLNETIKRTLSRYNIATTISDSLVFRTTEKRGKSVKELIDEKLTDDNKIILHIYGKCIEYKSAYIYQFDIHFASMNKKYSQALLYSSPQYNVMGIDTVTGMDRKFRKLMADAVADYLSANKANSK